MRSSCERRASILSLMKMGEQGDDARGAAGITASNEVAEMCTGWSDAGHRILTVGNRNVPLFIVQQLRSG